MGVDSHLLMMPMSSLYFMLVKTSKIFSEVHDHREQVTREGTEFPEMFKLLVLPVRTK